MKLLFQLQVWNRELRSELDLADGDVPQVDLQTDEFVEQLRQAALEGHLLSEELTAVHLTEAQASRLDRDLAKETEEPEHLPEDPERCCANIMEEVQKAVHLHVESAASLGWLTRNSTAILQCMVRSVLWG
eukprot:g29816.t1